MKKLKIKTLSLCALGLSTFCCAQIKFGVKAGAGASNTSVVHGVSTARIGLLGGAVLQYQLGNSERNYLQLEALYSNQGEYSSFQEGQKKYKAFVNYAIIPIMYKYYFDDQGSDFFVEAGPQLGFKVSDNFEDGEPEIDNNVSKVFDVAVNIGLGYSYDRKIELNLRYQYGLIDTFDYIKADNGVNRTSLLSLSLTYFIK